MELPGLRVRGVQRRQPVDLVGRHVEGGVLQPQRLEDAVAQEVLVRLAGDPRNQYAEQVPITVRDVLTSTFGRG